VVGNDYFGVAIFEVGCFLSLVIGVSMIIGILLARFC